MDAQVDVSSFLRTQLGRASIEAFAADVDGKGRYGGDNIRGLRDWGPAGLLGAEPIWVDENIVDLVQAAAEQWKPEPLRVTDLIAPSGFALMEKPVVLKDVRERRCAYRAFSWQFMTDESLQSSGVMIALWSHLDDTDDYTDADENWDPVALAEAWHPHKFMLLHMTPIWFNTNPVEADGLIHDAGGQTYQPEGVLPAGVFTFFRLAQQRILERDRIRPDRPYRRMAKRYGKEDAYVTVIRLRRPRTKYHGESDGDPVEWKQRWIVGGHWRRQPYGKKGEEPYYRHIWISPYVKGPDDKPLEIRELRAWEFVR